MTSTISYNNNMERSLNDWFSSTMENYLVQLNKMIKSENFCEAEYYRNSHFDQFRMITEMYYMITEYLPQLHNEEFALVVYNKIGKLYSQVKNHVIVPKTQTEINVVNILLKQLEEAEKTIKTSLNLEEDSSKRERVCVSYAGMDTNKDDDKDSDYEE